MARAARRALCSTCGKENGQVTCEGCSKIFCLKDFNGHRQELGKRLDEVEVDRDLFRQILTDKIVEPQNHILIEQINEWENESISKIRQAAEQARQILLKHTAELNIKTENKLNKLTNQLRQGREKNEFSELDLGEWRKELTEMTNELIKSSSVTIRQDRIPLVTKINVDISDETQDKKSNGTTNMSDTITKSKGLVSCSFCNEEFSPSIIGGHLMTCGNKTDQCPNCRKHIRRAIFRYHYENNCTNLKEFDADGSAATNQPDTLSTFQSNNLPQSPSRLAAGNSKQISTWNVGLSAHLKLQTVEPEQSDSATITMLCTYCYHECELADLDLHEEKCLLNPNNIAKRQQSQNNPPSNQTSDRLNHVDDPQDTDEIPCEICSKLIKWHDYRNHVQTCMTENDQRIQKQPKHTNSIEYPSGARCKYCHKNCTMTVFEYHQKTCKKNPVNVAVDEQYKNAHRLPPFVNNNDKSNFVDRPN